MTEVGLSDGTPVRVVETNEQIGAPALLTRFRSRAERNARRLNDTRRGLPSYRYEVRRVGHRWGVVALQNIAVPLRRGRR